MLINSMRYNEIYQDENSPYLKPKQQILDWLAIEDLTYWKIYFNGVLCGGIAYCLLAEGDCLLARVYIHPTFQGKGITRQAILLCEKELKHNGRYILDFPVGQIANKTCYENAGYKDMGKREVINDKLTLAIYEKIVE